MDKTIRIANTLRMAWIITSATFITGPIEMVMAEGRNLVSKCSFSVLQFRGRGRVEVGFLPGNRRVASSNLTPLSKLFTPELLRTYFFTVNYLDPTCVLQRTR